MSDVELKKCLPCCGYPDTSAVKWNELNEVVQCHACGTVYAKLTCESSDGCKTINKCAADNFCYVKMSKLLTAQNLQQPLVAGENNEVACAVANPPRIPV